MSFTSRSLLISCASCSTLMHFNARSFLSFLSASKSFIVEPYYFWDFSRSLSFILIFSCIFSTWSCIYWFRTFKFSNSSSGAVSFYNSLWIWANFSFLLLYFFYKCSNSLAFFPMSISYYLDREEILCSCTDNYWFNWLNTILYALSCWIWASICCSKSNSLLL